MVPRSATAITASAFGMPLDIRVVPSIGSTATSQSGPVPSPTSSPLYSIGASSSPPPLSPVSQPRPAFLSPPPDHDNPAHRDGAEEGSHAIAAPPAPAVLVAA